MKFVCVKEIDKTVPMYSGGNKKAIEKLFVPASQYKRFADMKQKASGSLFEEF